MTRKYLWMVLCATFLILASCQKSPFITLTAPKNYDFSRDGGTQTFALSCNRDWCVSSTDNWIQVSPSSGAATESSITITITCLPNSTYDTRFGTITLNAGELAETISVSQENGLGVVVSQTTFTITNEEQSIEVEIQNNVSYLVEIDDACKDWIRIINTKALTTDKVVFNISANTSFSDREGKVSFVSEEGVLYNSICIRQSQTDALIVANEEYTLSKGSQYFEVGINTNVDLEIASQVDWISHIQTKALNSRTVVLKIEKNTTSDRREGIVEFKQKGGTLNSSIRISQAGPPPNGVVDLGVVGVRENGSTYDLYWAECNLGANSPEQVGSYFAWGEIESKPINNYNWGHYKWCEGWNDNFTKYNFDDHRGIVDNKYILDLEDDAAHMTLGGKWRMPTATESALLLSCCDRESVDNYNGTDTQGLLFRGKGEYENNSIFLPAGGYITSYGSVIGMNEGCFYWTSELVHQNSGNLPSYALIMQNSIFERCCGILIRPVYEQ